MGIYDREYYREETRGSGWLSGLAPACKAIIAINAAAFLSELVLNNGTLIRDWFAASSDAILERGQVWRLVTATFLHPPGSLWGIAWNMLLLWFVGREMESFYGTREFWWFYLSSAALTTLVWAVYDHAHLARVPFLIGASGPLMAVFAIYTFYNPKREIMLFFVVQVEMWVALALYVGTDVVVALNGRDSNIGGVIPDLAGLGYAAAFFWIDLRLGRLRALFPKPGPRLRLVHPESPRRETSTPRPATASTANPTPGPSWSPEPGVTTRPVPSVVVTQEQLDARLDEILVKISTEGRAGLTEEETRILDEASRRARSKLRDRF